jgi:hypothetical protein
VYSVFLKTPFGPTAAAKTPLPDFLPKGRFAHRQILILIIEEDAGSVNGL